jgi:hypothetical protein
MIQGGILGPKRMWFRVLLNQRSINRVAISFAHESELGLATPREDLD